MMKIILIYHGHAVTNAILSNRPEPLSKCASFSAKVQCKGRVQSYRAMAQCKDTVQLYKAIVQMYSTMVQRYDAGHNCGFCERPGGVSPIYQNVSDQTQLLRNDDDQWLEMMMMMMIVIVIVFMFHIRMYLLLLVKPTWLENMPNLWKSVYII